MTDLPIDPIKLCCFRKMSEHTGPRCPDGKVPCCHCFFRFELEELAVDAEGQLEDVCKPCRAHEIEMMERRHAD